MLYLIYDSKGTPLCGFKSWPMARAALDYFCTHGDGCPRLEVRLGDSFGFSDLPFKVGSDR